MNRLLFILILISSCHKYQQPHIEKYAKGITLKYVDIDIETPIDISCNDFEKYFQNVHTYIINDSIKISQILKNIEGLKIAGSEYYQNVDTRLKLEIYYSNDSTETLCMDRFVVSRNSHLYLNSDALKFLLLEK